jgi:hypothetical protein
VLLEFEFRASQLLGRNSTSWATLPFPFRHVGYFPFYILDYLLDYYCWLLVHRDICKCACNIPYLDFMLSIILLYTHLAFLRMVSVGLIAPFSHTYIIFLTYSPSFNLSLCFPPSQWYQPPDRTCFTFLSFIFEKKTFLFV